METTIANIQNIIHKDNEFVVSEIVNKISLTSKGVVSDISWFNTLARFMAIQSLVDYVIFNKNQLEQLDSLHNLLFNSKILFFNEYHDYKEEETPVEEIAEHCGCLCSDVEQIEILNWDD